MARVLLVDEDAAIREATAMRLQVDGHHVIAVATADAGLAEAARCAEENTPLDVAVLDVEAPGVNDSALMTLLRTHHVSGSLPVVFYTGTPGASVLHGLSLAGSSRGTGHPLTRLLATIDSLSPAGGDPGTRAVQPQD